MAVCITHLGAKGGAAAPLVIVQTFDAGSDKGHGALR